MDMPESWSKFATCRGLAALAAAGCDPVFMPPVPPSFCFSIRASNLSTYSSMAFASLRFSCSLSSNFSSNSSSFLTSARLSCNFSVSLSERASARLCASRAASDSRVADLISKAASSTFLEASASERSASLSFACSASWMAFTASSVFSTAERSPANAEWSSSLMSIVSGTIVGGHCVLKPNRSRGSAVCKSTQLQLRARFVAAPCKAEAAPWTENGSSQNG